MVQNQILATLQIENSEIRLVVGEYFRDIFYVIAKDTINCKGTNGSRIIDQKKVIESIREICNKISAKINAPLQNVLLVIPGNRFKIETKQLKDLLHDGNVTRETLSKLESSAYKSNIGFDSEVINLCCSYYKINGIVYPKPPIGEKGEMISCEYDLICGDKLTVYDYVSVVEKAGLNVIAIAQDGYCAAKEAALIEQSINSYALNIYLEASHTVYQLIYNGRVVGGYSEITGYDSLIRPLMAKYGISYTDSSRLLFRYGVVGKKTGEERVISKLSQNNRSIQITYKDVQESICEKSMELVDNLYKQCEDILKQKNISIVITGQGAALQNLSESLTEKFQKEVKCYCPDILGARDYKWSSALGMFYIYKESQAISGSYVNCVNIDLYKTNLKPKIEEVEEHLTSKIKEFTGKLFTEKES